MKISPLVNLKGSRCVDSTKTAEMKNLVTLYISGKDGEGRRNMDYEN
jgi:hypothetical protein